MLPKEFASLVASTPPMRDVIAAIPFVDCNVSTFHAKWPRLLKYFPQDKGSPAQWVDFAIKHPEKRMFIDYSRFNDKHWTTLLSTEPRYIEHAVPYLNLLQAGHWKCILLKYPGLIHHAAVMKAVTDVMLQMPLNFDARAIHPFPIVATLGDNKQRGIRPGGLFGRMTGTKARYNQQSPIIPVTVKRRRNVETVA